MAAVGLALLLDPVYGPLRGIPPAFRDPLRAAAVLLVGASLSLFVERHLFGLGERRLPPRQVTVLRFLSRLVLYVSVPLAALAAFGVGVPSVVFGGAFFTVIIGLAGQTMFSNLIAGFWLVLFHPFEVGERIELVAWQYPVLMPSYPHDLLRPAYAGVVVDINLMYTTLESDAGPPMLIPNGVVVQALITNRSRAARRMLRVRLECGWDLPPEAALEAVATAVHALPGLTGASAAAWLADIGPQSYAIVITAAVADESDDEAKSHLLRQAAQALAGLRPTPARPS